MNKLPTIKEIAKHLNVSVSTVSRALSDHPRIGLRTRLQVQQLARELGYEPNAKAVSFKQQRSFVVGVVLPFIREEFFSQAICGIDAAATESNYTILFGQSYDDAQKEINVVDAMRRQRVDGLLISLSKETNTYEHLKMLDKYNIPVVFFDRVPPFDEANRVFCNLYKGTVEMVGWLMSRGYKRIAMINGPQKIRASKDRLNGYVEGHARRKLKVDMQLVEVTDLSRASTYEAMSRLLQLKKRPEAIITFNEYVHMDAVQFAQQQNIQVNKDIVFASYANLPITSYTSFPPLVSVEQYPYGQGERAMELLIRILNERKGTDRPMAFETEEIPATLVVQPGKK